MADRNMMDRDPFAVRADDDDSGIVRVTPVAAAPADVVVVAAADDAPAPPPPPDAPPEGERPRPRKKAARPPAASGPSEGGGRARGGGPRPPRRPPVDDADATRRGAIVIAVTVVVGLLVFWFGVNKPPEVLTSSTDTIPSVPTTDRNAAPAVTGPAPGTTVAAPPTTQVAPADLQIVVANGIDPKQVVAGPVVATLKAKGYTKTTAADLPTAVAKSAVYYAESLTADAQAIAVLVGLDPATTVQAMPAKPPTTLNGAKILVVIGKDRA